ncbi:MAG: hypothetical protein LJE96_09430 [Deltaproteobacteria bacterium]|nr:hypothetical protein [Deltaproteobacteria bacterium]
MKRKGFFGYLAILSVFAFLAACSSSDDNTSQVAIISGYVQHGTSPVYGSTVTLYRAASSVGGAPTALGTSQTDTFGKFRISYLAPEDKRAILYLIAQDQTGSVQMATVFGAFQVPAEVVLNERTTAGTAYCMARFMDGSNMAGPYPGLQNAAKMLGNLVDPASGDISKVLNEFPNGDSTITRDEFNSLANMLASCVETPGTCFSIFEETTTPDGLVPENTLQAAINIAHFPWWNVDPLFAISQSIEIYTPNLQSAPDAWTLAIRYEGNRHELDGPGNVAFDADGNAWIANNYTYSADRLDPNVCGDDHLIALTATGDDLPGAPYQGGGLYGAGYGVILDKDGYVWVGNFGFSGSKCPVPPGGKENQEILWNSVSKFRPDGSPISPDGDLSVNPVIPGGYLSDEDARPQGMAADWEGNVWVANCRSASVTKFLPGDPPERVVYGDFGLDKPFDVAIDPLGRAWITSNNNHSLYRIDPDGKTQFIGDSVFQRPMGIAGDSQGNMWVSNSGALDPPCGENTIQAFIDFVSALSHDKPVPGASVSMIMPNGTPSAGSPYTGGGLYMPWGIAVDGDDNVFVSNFTGKRLSYLCGADTSNCPPGFETGDPISPDGGYTFEGLLRVTAVQIDPSGNVWLTNNWESVPAPTNPGGHQMVVFIGLAAPVKTPLIGSPRKP